MGDKYIPLCEVLDFSHGKARQLADQFTVEELDLLDKYSLAFKTYEFSTVVLRKEDIDSAIEVFTRINTVGQTLTLFEIMSAKTYAENQNFDMQVKWADFSAELAEAKYDSISSTVALSVLSLVLSRTKECKRKTILSLDKQAIIDTWERVISALKDSVDYFRTTYRIPVSHLLPYDSLLVPFAYFFVTERNLAAQHENFWKSFFGECHFHSGTPAPQSRGLHKIFGALMQFLQERDLTTAISRCSWTALKT